MYPLNRLLAVFAALLAMLMIVSACQTPAAAIPEITIKATEYAFDAPDQIEAGLVSITLDNAGREIHHLQLVRLNDGVTLAQFETALQQDPDSVLSLVSLAGGVTDTPAGEQVKIVASLTEGQYVLVCFASDAEGVPHAMKGMIKPITVVARTNPAAASEPSADVSVVMRDFAFDLPPTIEAGPRMWRFANQGQQMHEMSIVRLAPGKTIDDVLAFAQTFEGEPPGEEISHLMTILPAQNLWTTLDLEAGDYLVICFFPDHESGQPHAALGMIRPFTVK